MIKAAATLFLLLAALSTAVSCKGSTSDPGTLRFSDPGKPIAVKAGQEFVVEMEINPTFPPAYRYELQKTPSDCIAFVGIEKESTVNEDRRPGSSGGRRGHRFKAVRAGQATIVFATPAPAGNPDALKPITFSVAIAGP